MQENFDAYEFIAFLRARWRVVAIACVTAVALAALVTALMPRRYTATASILIELPGGNDARMSTAVSPVYLESLKTYERFAESDTLFERAVQKFGLQKRWPSQPMESLKKRVLKVNKVRDTRILEIDATLPDPRLAQQFVQFLANETVELNRRESVDADRDLVERTTAQLAAARERLDRARAAEVAHDSRESADAMQASMAADRDVLAAVRHELIRAEGDAAEYAVRGDAFAKDQLAAARARAAALRADAERLGRTLDSKTELLSKRAAERDQLQAAVRDAESDYDTVAERAREVQASAGMRTERLRIIDPGVAPEKPSSPNAPLNVVAALLAALLLSVGGLAFRFAYERARPSPAEAELRRQAVFR